MKVLITGGTGNVGKALTERLIAEGDSVTLVGRRPTASVGKAAYRQCDIMNFDSLTDAARGMDGIIHLAAVPSPGRFPAQELFHTNVSGTFNVFQAAWRNDIKRVVTASSINAFGFNYGTEPFLLDYLPIDEETPGMTTDEYSFSKVLVEDIGTYHWRRYGISSVSIRIPWVYEARQEVLTRFEEAPRRFREEQERLSRLSDGEREEEIGRIIRGFDEYRKARYEPGYQRSAKGVGQKDKSPLLWGRSDFYTLIDERDCAQGFAKALKASLDGAHTLFINDSHNFTGLNSKELAELAYPRPRVWTGRWKNVPEGSGSLVSIEKARGLIGFEPEYSLSRL